MQSINEWHKGINLQIFFNNILMTKENQSIRSHLLYITQFQLLYYTVNIYSDLQLKSFNVLAVNSECSNGNLCRLR